MELKADSQDDYFISEYENLVPEDITDISNFNVNGAVGISAGFGSLLLRAQYVYGFTNILGQLNKQDLEIGNVDKFRGIQSLLAFRAMFFFNLNCHCETFTVYAMAIAFIGNVLSVDQCFNTG